MATIKGVSLQLLVVDYYVDAGTAAVTEPTLLSPFIIGVGLGG